MDSKQRKTSTIKQQIECIKSITRQEVKKFISNIPKKQQKPDGTAYKTK